MSDVFHASYFAPRAADRRGPGGKVVLASLALHIGFAALLVGDVVKSSQPLPEYKVYRVDIYSPPPNVEGEPEAIKSQPAVIKPPEEKQVTVEKRPAPVKAPTKKAVATEKGTSDVAKGRNSDPKALVGGEGIDVHMAGDEFPYPAYLNNIITQLNRYFRWTGAPNLETRVGFEIMRDGRVRNIRVLNKSGNINFDLEAISAIEQAGKRGAFGPLPKGWVPNTLPIAFSFVPPGR